MKKMIINVGIIMKKVRDILKLKKGVIIRIDNYKSITIGKFDRYDSNDNTIAIFPFYTTVSWGKEFVNSNRYMWQCNEKVWRLNKQEIMLEML